jgi:hypothetical protein
MNKIVDELETVTTIPSQALNKLIERTIYCICEDIDEAKLVDNISVDFDIGIGTLTISKINDSLKYRFVPSAKLNDNIAATIVDNKNPMTAAVEESLVNKITNVYKNLL